MSELKDYWWCPNCKIELAGNQVTFSEKHEDCGFPATWVEVSRLATPKPNDAKNPDGKQMIEAYLKANGFEGLYSDECGCELCDLMPCGGDWAIGCQAGYKHHGDFEVDGEKTDWAISPTPPKQSEGSEDV